MTDLKVGDKVICINSGITSPDNRNGGSGWREGDIFTIRDISVYEHCRVLWGDTYNGYGVYATWVRKYGNLRDVME